MDWLVGSNRRGNQSIRQALSTLFLCAYLNKIRILNLLIIKKMKSKIVFYDRTMTIPVKSGIVNLFYGELMYIKFEKPFCILHFTKSRKYWVEISVREMMAHLPEAVFLKCKRSAILNLSYLKGCYDHPPTIVMADGERFSFSKQNVLNFQMMSSRLHDLSPSMPHLLPMRGQCL